MKYRESYFSNNFFSLSKIDVQNYRMENPRNKCHFAIAIANFCRHFKAIKSLTLHFLRPRSVCRSREISPQPSAKCVGKRFTLRSAPGAVRSRYAYARRNHCAFALEIISFSFRARARAHACVRACVHSLACFSFCSCLNASRSGACKVTPPARTCPEYRGSSVWDHVGARTGP